MNDFRQIMQTIFILMEKCRQEPEKQTSFMNRPCALPFQKKNQKFRYVEIERVQHQVHQTRHQYFSKVKEEQDDITSMVSIDV